MSKLSDAINVLQLHAQSTHRLRDWQEEIGLVLWAAKAFSCDECGGTGRVRVAVADAEVSCPKCCVWRANLQPRKGKR